VNKRLN